jgi:hypothetical protein
MTETMTEVDWVPVRGFPGYSVSTSGRVRNDAYPDGGRQLSVRVNQYGVPYVGMMRNGRQVVRSLPLLVASAFIPRPTNFDAKFDTPINLDGDRTNCRVDNLAWRPLWFASEYYRQFESRYRNPINVPIRDVETGVEYPNSLAVACANGLLEQDVVLTILNNTITWPTFQKFVVVD